jgi:tripartite-type tricarboxylate transporter receptor subunit TctC
VSPVFCGSRPAERCARCALSGAPNHTGPVGLPQEIVTRLNTEIGHILFLPDVKKQMEDIAVEVAKSSPNELAELTRADADKWGKIIKELNLTPL